MTSVSAFESFQRLVGVESGFKQLEQVDALVVYNFQSTICSEKQLYFANPLLVCFAHIGENAEM